MKENKFKIVERPGVWKHGWSYGWNTHKNVLVFGLLITIILVCIIRYCFHLSLSTFWAVAEPVSGVLTMLIAFMIWLGEMRQEYEEALPCKMTASYVVIDKGVEKEIMRCEYAFLTGPDDIRTWGQQLGRQMTDGGNLDLYPDLLGKIDLTHMEDENGDRFKLYTVKFHLRNVPGNLVPDKNTQTTSDDDTPKNYIECKRIIWTPDNGFGANTDQSTVIINDPKLKPKPPKK